MKDNRTLLQLDVVIRKIEGISVPTKNEAEAIMNSPGHLYGLHDTLVQEAVQEENDLARLLAWVVFSKRRLKLEKRDNAKVINPRKQLTKYEEYSGDKLYLIADGVYLVLNTLLDIVYLYINLSRFFLRTRTKTPTGLQWHKPSITSGIYLHDISLFE